MVMSIAHVCLASLGRGLQIILQPPYLCSLHPCSPKAQAPNGIIQESLVLQLSRPNYSQRTKTCFGCAMILTTGSDNIPYMIHLLHLQLSDTTIRSLFYFTFTDPHAELSKARVIYFSQKSPVVGLRSPIYGNGYSCNNKSVLCTPLQGETS